MVSTKSPFFPFVHAYTVLDVLICNLMRIGRWSEISVDRVCLEHEVMREGDANETSCVLGAAMVELFLC